MNCLATTALDPSFLRAVVLTVGFKPKPAQQAQAALLMIGLQKEEFTAADISAGPIFADPAS